MLQKYSHVFLGTFIAFLTSPAYAQFQKAQTMLMKVERGLNGLSVIVVTLAVLWVGYKVLFDGSTIRECAPIIIGAGIIASAAEVAKLLVG